MKKITFILGLALVLAAPLAQASTITLSPSTLSVSSGQTVSVVVSVDAQGATLTTVESQISYPANLLTPTSFAYAPAWMAMSQPGYDQMSGGTVIKTAGYPRGFTGVQTFGTLTFRAIATGTGAVSVSNGSITYTPSGQNVLTGAQGSIAVSVSPAAATTASTEPTVAQGTAGGQPAAQAASTVAQGTTTDGTTATAATAEAVPLAAAAAGATGFHMSGWAWAGAVVLLIGLIVLGRYMYGRRKTVVVTTSTQK